MRGIHTILALLLFGLAGCASVVRPAPTVPDYFVMRHLQTPAGATDPDLTDEGRRNARLLIVWFRHQRPDAIYVSDTKRARQTADPLARSLKIVPKVYRPADTAGLIAALSMETGTVLVVGHSNTVPDIIDRLGGHRPAPLAHEDFGDIWRVSGTPRTTQHSRIDARR